MKALLLITSLLLLASCEGAKQTVVGTIVSVEQTVDKACDFGTITIQPSGTQAGGEFIYLNLKDMDDRRAAEVSKYLNKKVHIKFERDSGTCGKTLNLEITEIQ